MTKIKGELEVLHQCKNCRNWKNNQAELDYAKHYGFCVTPKNAFITTRVADVRVYDRRNIRTVGFPAHQIETVQDQPPMVGVPVKSNYSLVTEEEFGCIHFNS